MNLWQQYEKANCTAENKGFSMHFEKGVEPKLRQLFLSFAKWLRKKYTFPEHIHIYILKQEKVILMNGEQAYGSFKWFAQRPPRIKIPAKIEAHLLEYYCLEEIYEQILSSLVHELTHYFQYESELKQSNAGSEWQANYYRYRILELYYREMN